MNKDLVYKFCISILLIFIFSITYIYTQNETDNEFKITFLNIGQGDAIFIDTPNGFQILIDAGKGRDIKKELYNLMNKIDKKINMVIATHADTDHIGGFREILDSFEIDYFVKTNWPEDKGYTSTRLEEKIKEEDLEVVLIDKPQYFKIDGVKIYFLWPTTNSKELAGSNSGSIITLIEYKNSTALLTGDANKNVEDLIARTYPSLIDVDLLKAGHHGSRTSSSQFFLEKTTPEYFIISAGKNNTYGHPHNEPINNAEKVKAEVLHTKEGSLSFIAKGGTFIRE